MPDILHTDRLLLRPFTLDDAAAYWPLVRMPEILRFTGETPVGSVADVRELLQARPLRDYSRHGYGRLACVEKASGKLIGFCGLKYLEDLQQTDLGYRFLPSHWGAGYATESADAVMAHGRKVLGLSRIIGLVVPENVASARVLIKMGLRYESQFRPEHCDSDLDLYAWEQRSVA